MNVVAAAARFRRAVLFLSAFVSVPFITCAADVPVLTRQPQHQTVMVGGAVTFRVEAAAQSPLSYQWQFNGADLPNQHGDSLALTNLSTNAAGRYSVVVSTPSASVTSAVAILSVNVQSFYFGGYATIFAPPGYSLVTAQLAAFAEHRVGVMFPDVPNGTTIFKLDGNGFVANNYLGGWSDPDMNLVPGEGWFVRNPTTNALTLLVLGSAQIGHLANQLPAGLAICSSILPQSGGLSTPLRFFPDARTKVYLFDNGTSTYQSYTKDESDWSPNEPQIQSWSSFWVQSTDPQDWVRIFTGDGSEGFRSSYLIIQPGIISEIAEVNFFTYHTNPALGRVFDVDGVTPVTNNFSGQLFATLTADESLLAPVGKPVAFLAGPAAGYIRSETVRLPGIAGGQTVHLQLRVWEHAFGQTYESALANGSKSGKSALYTVTAHATVENGEPGLPPQDASGFPSFRVVPGQDAGLRITRIMPVVSGLTIGFTTRLGRNYSLQRTDTLAEAGVWEMVPGAELIVGTGLEVQVTLNEAASQPQRFYRACRLP